MTAGAGAVTATGIHRLEVPTPFAVGTVNAWLIEDDPLTLVDSGPDSVRSLRALEDGLAARGHRVEDIGLLLVTHHHIDHVGLLDELARRSGAEVAALDLLAPFLGDFEHWMERNDELAERIMHRHGVPDDIVLALRAVTRMTRAWGGSAQVTRPLPAGGEVRLRDRTLTVLHRPGHSPGDTVFHDAEARVALAGDHLIARISSNPVLTIPLEGELGPDERPHALLAYLDSLRATRETDLDVVLPGHGAAFGDHRALIDERFAMHERRAEKILDLVREQPRSAHAVAQAIWGRVAITQAFLTLSEVLGHVDLLLRDGLVEEVEEDGVVRLRAV